MYICNVQNEVVIMRFELMQWKWYRKWKGGSYYLIRTWLPMNDFWTDKLITSCGGRAVKEEHYPK